MDIQFDKSYDKPAYLIRYAALLFFNLKERSKIGQKLVQTSNDLKFFAYPTTLINNTADNFISNCLKSYLTSENGEKIVLEMNQMDSHFIDSIGVSDIASNIDKIFEAYNNFYNCGNFNKLIRACYRFLKRIQGANEYEMNDIVIRYMFSCICMNDYDNCINIIENVGQNYVLFDYNIYVFLLYLVQGKYEDACKKILQIQNNVCEDFYNFINEKDLAFYFSFCLLYNFKSENYKQVLSNNETLVYKLYDKYSEYFKIVDEYYRCDYLKVNSEFNKVLKERINKDPFLSGFSQKIEEKFKKKILKEILSFASEIDFETIQKLLLLDTKIAALNMVEDLIQKERVPAIIDDINELVIIKEKNPINDLLENSNNLMKKNLIDLLKYSVRRNVKHKLSPKSFNGGDIEKKLLKEGEGDIDMAHFMGIPISMMG